MPGTLVVVEGIDGGGKSTLIQGLTDLLAGEGYSVIRTREPTDGPHGRALRRAAAEGRRFEPEEELRLFVEDRKQHVEEVVLPALRRGDVVLQDRSFYSTAAYQGARGLDRAAIIRESRKYAPEPDVLLVIDLPVELGLERADRRGSGRDAFEDVEALKGIRDFFLSLEHAVRLDGSAAPAQVLSAASEAVRHHLRKY